MDEEETSLVRAGRAAIDAFEQRRPNSERLASLHLFGVAAENCLSHFLLETDLMEALFRISRAREEAELSDGY